MLKRWKYTGILLLLSIYAQLLNSEEKLDISEKAVKEVGEEAGDGRHILHEFMCRISIDHILKGMYKQGHYRLFANLVQWLPSSYKGTFHEARSWFYLKEFIKAEKVIDRILSNSPNADAWYFKGEVCEKLRKFTHALQAYKEAAEQGIIQAEQARRRLLLNLGATSLVEEMPGNSKEIREIIAGDKVIRYLQWNEPENALNMLNENSSVHLDSSDFHDRRRFDSIIALRKSRFMVQAVLAVEKYEKNEAAPLWVQNARADALLYLRRPNEAIKIYRQLLLNMQKNNEDRYPLNYNLNMAVYSCLVEMENYDEAAIVLKNIRSEIKPKRVIRGVLQNDHNMVNTAVESIWLLIYQNRLEEAFYEVSKLHRKAPGNRKIQLLLGSVLYFRGLPRQAFEVLKPLYNSIDPEEKDDTLEVTYLTVLNETGSKNQARIEADVLQEKYPRYTNVIRLLEEQQVEDSSLLRLDYSFTDYFRARLETPLDVNNRVYQEYSWWHDSDANTSFRNGSSGTSNGSGAYRQFLTLGATGEIVKDLDYDFSLRADFKGRIRPGLGLLLEIDDHWSISANYTGLSDDTPVIDGLYAQAFSLGASWYSNESFKTSLRAQFIDQSDNNDIYQLSWRSQLRIYSRAFWNFEVHKEVSFINRKFRSDIYYSPEQQSSAYIIPRIEHIFYRHYERSLAHRLLVGAGLKTESEYGSGEVWFLRYEHDWTLSKRLTLQWGVNYSLNRYYGDDENDLNFYSTLIWRF